MKSLFRWILTSALVLSSTAQATIPAPLEAKLKRIARLQAGARTQVTERMDKGLTPIARAEWEALLESGKPESSLTAAELETLRSHHQTLIARARKDAQAASNLSLEELRAKDQATQDRFCRELPKGAMLHLHPWGTLHRPAVIQVLDAVNPLIDLGKLRAGLYSPGQPGAFYPGELDFLTPYGQQVHYANLREEDQRRVQDLFFLPAGAHDFKRFMGVFTFLSSLAFSNPKVDAEPILWDAFLHDAAGLGVRYVEVTTNVRNSASWAQGLEPWAAKLKAKHGVTVRLLAAFNRMLDAERNREQTRKLLALPASPVLVGANLQADETDHPMLEKGQTIFGMLRAAREQGRTTLRMAPHAGELGDSRNSRDALILGAERIGHGVKLADDVVTLELARRQGLAVEANLESNLRLKVVGAMAQHPFLDQLRLGLKVSLSTDDEGMFDSDIHDECLHAVRETDIEYSELKRMSYNSIETSFADAATRASLKGQLDQDFARFEQNW